MKIEVIKEIQVRLGVNRGTAIRRLIGFIFLMACFPAILVISVIFFPRTASFGGMVFHVIITILALLVVFISILINNSTVKSWR